MTDQDIRGVIFIIENKFNRFLLEQRDSKSKLDQWSWVFPGGKKDEGEGTFDTVLREAEEEFGIRLIPEKCKKIGVATTHSGNGINEIWYCLIDDERIPLLVKESAGAGWFTLDEIKTIDLGYKQSELVLPIIDSAGL
jgi:8-oxo-dGTP pyrophosphatase MutT (NUDIX family)